MMWRRRVRHILERSLSFCATLVQALLRNPVALGVAAVVEQNGRVVLVWHSYKSGWMFPGGGVERGEAPAHAVIRELKEEIGLIRSQPPELLGVYLQQRLLVGNLVLLYRVAEAEFEFHPSWEIRKALVADPEALPPGTSPAVIRRLAEIAGKQAVSPRW